MASYSAGPYNSLGAVGGNAVVLSNVGLQVYSAQLLLKAQPILRFNSIVTEKTELGKQPGESIRFVRYNPVTGSSTLTEGTAIIPAALTTGYVDISVGEHGKAIEVTQLRIATSFTNVMADAAMLLGRHMAVDTNGRIRDTLTAAASTVYASNRTSRATLIAADVFNTEIVREAIEQLAINKAPKFGGDAYICFVHPHQAGDLRRDPDWISSRHYATPEAILNGEIGRFEDVRFIETTMIEKITATSGVVYADGTATGVTESTKPTVDTYRSIIVGDHCIGHAVALPVEMRQKLGDDDYQRERGVAWYTIDGYGIIESGHIFNLETA